MRYALALLLVLAATSSATAQEPFFAPAQPSGTIEVKLYPTEVVTSGQQKLVTLGVPFPRGSITAAQLGTLRVLKAGIEIPAHVTQLTPWRHRSNAAIDGQSVRVARVQIQNTFTTLFPGFETVEVQWGGTPRTLDVPALTPPRNAWHTVTSGTYVASDMIQEPDVYAVLPREWLAAGVLKPSRSFPFDPTNLEPRDNPATNDAIANWPGTQESERAFKNNFYSVTNRDAGSPSEPCPYKTDREPWLYDRGATMFVLYLRSGYFTALRESVRATEFYANRVNASGFFTLAPNDAKYAYNESMAYSHWLTADDTHLTRIGNTTIGLQSGFNHVWTPAVGFWTERHAAFKLLGNVVAWEVLGGTTRRDAVNGILLQFRNHQDDTGNQIPPTSVDGGLYHTGSQHDGDWGGASFGASSWMSALLSDAAVRAYATGEDVQTAQFVARLGNFLRATVVDTDDNEYDDTLFLALPRYAMLIDGSAGQQNPDDVEHSLDVAGQIAWADYFARVAGTPNPALAARAQDLYETYDIGVNYWIDPGGPPGQTAFAVSPWRKWGWEHRTSDGFGWALAAGTTPPMFANGFENP